MVTLLMLNVAVGDCVYQQRNPVYYTLSTPAVWGDTESVSNFISVIMKDQLNLRGLVLLEAPETTRAWKMPHGKLTEGDDWHNAVTRWCGLAESGI